VALAEILVEGGRVALWVLDAVCLARGGGVVAAHHLGDVGPGSVWELETVSLLGAGWGYSEGCGDEEEELDG